MQDMQEHFVANIDYFKKNKAVFAKKYPNKVLLIVDCKVEAAFGDERTAYQEAVKKHRPGEFVVQATNYETENISHYHSGVVL